MCSLWVTMEHDEGDLEAVVRAGRGLASSSLLGRHPNDNIHHLHNNNNTGNGEDNSIDPWQAAAVGVEPGPACFGGLQGAAPDDGMGFPNLLRMDLQGLCSIPFYNGGMLLRSAASDCSPMFENVEQQEPSVFAEARPNEAPPKAERKQEELTEVPGSKPPEASGTARRAEAGDASSNSPSLAHPKSASTSAPTTTKNPGAKRRKTQQKKIVCVPAAGGSNRPSGEGLPSDLWAWRKYGQKPIKGSPYPRGYYRCSSSKGCSARKQVERSRTDPTMLVITYTSDHNHPWPTHRNALAGSTRQINSAEKVGSAVPQSPETTTTTNNNNNSSSNNNNNNSNTAESSEAMAAENLLNSSPAAGADQSGHGDIQTHNLNVQDDEEQAGALDRLFGDHPHHDDDFFADLGELPESLNVLALRHFDEDKSDDEAAGSVPVSSTNVADPFNLFNWSSSTFVDTETAM